MGREKTICLHYARVDTYLRAHYAADSDAGLTEIIHDAALTN